MSNPRHDVKFSKALPRDGLKLTIKVSPELIHVANAFSTNLRWIQSLAQLPPALAYVVADVQSTQDKALINVLGSFPAEPLDEENSKKFEEEYRRLVQSDLDALRQSGAIIRDRPSEEYSKIVHEDGMEIVDRFASSSPLLTQKLDVLLQFLIVGAWSTFEVFAGDLWRAALNAQPQGLATLSGHARELGNEEGMKSIRLRDIEYVTKGDFNLGKKMGDLLYGKFKFISLAGIRTAYAAAFHHKIAGRSARIQTVLKDKALDALALMRNVILHNAGVADEEYAEKCAHVPLAPKLPCGERIRLDGELVDAVVAGSMKCAAELIRGVDSWIQLDRPKVSLESTVIDTSMATNEVQD